jgi:hypothetical protein
MKKEFLIYSKFISYIIFISLIFIVLASLKTNYLKYRIDNSGILHELQKRNGTTGFANGHIKDTFYAWYTNDLYPLTKEVNKKLSSSKTSQNDNSRDTGLIMRDGSTIFQGEFYRLHYSVPSYIFDKKISPTTSNIILSLISLMLIISVCFKEKKVFLVVFVILLISSDFYIYENFINQNIFAVPISLSIIFFLSIYYVSKNFKKFYYLYPLLLGFLISFLTNIRTEFMYLIFTYLIITFIYLSFRKVFISNLILLVAVYSTNIYLNQNFINKINKTNTILNNNNGIPYNGPIGGGHTFWHPFWMGFGDNKIGQNLGFQWGDIYAYNYVAKINPKLFTTNDIDGHYLTSSYDEFGIYRKKPELILEYQETLKNDLYNKIKENKINFIKIYIIKLKNFLTKLQGIDYSFFNNIFLQKYINGFFIFIVSLIGTSYILIKARNFKNFKFYLFFLFSSLPTGLPALIVSDMGATYVSFFHIILFSSFMQLLYDYKKTNLPKSLQL